VLHHSIFKQIRSNSLDLTKQFTLVLAIQKDPLTNQFFKYNFSRGLELTKEGLLMHRGLV